MGYPCVGSPCIGPFSTDMTLALLDVIFNRETDVSGVDVSGVDVSGVDVSGVEFPVVDVSGVDFPVDMPCNMFGMDASGLCPIYQRELCECIHIMDMSGNPIVELDVCIVDISSNETDVSSNETDVSSNETDVSSNKT